MIEGVHFYQNLNPAVVLNPDMVLNPGVVMAGMRRMHEASLALPVHVNQVEPIRSMRLQEVHRRTVNSPRQFQVRPVQWFNHIVQLNPSDRDRAEFVHLFANPQPRVPEDIPEPNVGNPPNQ
ncbi:uncharacterized protein LOC124371463 [Homalodisca vitripennis]|nr:uncharacterized protein LOC124371463 [Homalodisca vitripennis]